MSGHNKWSKIKHKKAGEDSEKSKIFSKLASEISIAARAGTDPQFNASLRSAVERARKQNMPIANIERAIQKAAGGVLEQIVVEAYGPSGVGIVIEAQTDNKNRALTEIRTVLKKHDVNIADPGSLMWSFEKTPDGYSPKFPIVVSPDVAQTVASVKDVLLGLDDVTGVYTSIAEQK